MNDLPTPLKGLALIAMLATIMFVLPSMTGQILFPGHYQQRDQLEVIATHAYRQLIVNRNREALDSFNCPQWEGDSRSGFAHCRHAGLVFTLSYSAESQRVTLLSEPSFLRPWASVSATETKSGAFFAP